MPTPTEVAEAHYASQLRQEEAASLILRRLWRRMDADDLDGSWARIVRRLTLTVGSAQLGAARAGAVYVPLALGAAGADPVADGEPDPSRWAGIASDGRALDSLLYASVVHVRQRFGAGELPREALQAGGKWLEGLARTQIADAARGSAGVAIAARPRVGYVRMVSAPCCQRCAVLAGKTFKWNTGFLRHKRCRCRHVPVERDHPSGYKSDITADDVRDLTEAQRKAIADGADLNQTINAHRKGRRSSDGMTTSEGTTRRGLAGQRGATQRLTPEAIYRVSATREEAVVRLKANGYLI